MMTKAAELIQLIEEAFAESRYPGDNYITRCSYIPRFGECWECKEIREYFRGKTWKGHEIETLRYHAAALSLFTPSAYAYYWPAFLIADLTDPEEADVIVSGLLWDVSGKISESQDGIRERLALLTQTQRDALIAYFEYVGERDEEMEEASRAISVIQSIIPS